MAAADPCIILIGVYNVDRDVTTIEEHLGGRIESRGINDKECMSTIVTMTKNNKQVLYGRTTVNHAAKVQTIEVKADFVGTVSAIEETLRSRFPHWSWNVSTGIISGSASQFDNSLLYAVCGWA